MAFDLKEIIASRLGENYELHDRHINRTLVAAQRVIGFDKVYARAEAAYLYDMDNQPYLDFLSGYSVFNIGRNHPLVKQAIRDVLDLDLPNMVQMDCSLLSGLLAEALLKDDAEHLNAVFFCTSGPEAVGGPSGASPVGDAPTACGGPVHWQRRRRTDRPVLGVRPVRKGNRVRSLGTRG